jgi:Flp pilus assembly pilin Flp
MVSTGMVLLANVFDGFEGIEAGGLFLFLSVLMISVFSFVSIAVWTEARRKEREAYYKAESLRRVAEMPGDGAKYVIEMMKEDERIRQVQQFSNEMKKLEGMKIGGLVNIAVGIGLFCLIYFTADQKGAAFVGFIPGLIGVALLVYALFLAPRPS